MVNRRNAINMRGTVAARLQAGAIAWLVAAPLVPLVTDLHAHAGGAAGANPRAANGATGAVGTASVAPTPPGATAAAPTPPGATAAAPARKPLPDADAWCDERTGEVFRKIGNGWHEVSGEGEDEYVDETAHRLYWRGRLDRDKRDDMVLTTACTPVQCEYLFYVQCADGTFSRVFTTTATDMTIKPKRKTWAHVRYSAITDEVNGRYVKEWMTAALGVDLR